MKCKEVKYYINDYADGLLPDEMREDIHAHILICEKCRNEYEEIQSIKSEAANLPDEIFPSQELWEGINSRINPGKKQVNREAKIYNIASNKSVSTFGESLTLRFKQPSHKRTIYAAGLAFVLMVIVSISLLTLPGPAPAAFLQVQSLEGTSKISDEQFSDIGLIKIGDWLETDALSRAKIIVGSIGEVEVEQDSRIKLVQTKANEHRLALDKGKIHATIWAPPRLFFVETPSATAVDLGCMYSLEVDDNGSTFLHVTSGWVALENNGQESIIPAGAVCATYKSSGTGTPYFKNSDEKFINTLQLFDSGVRDVAVINELLKTKSKDDLLSLWHIIPKVDEKSRGEIFAAMKKLVDVPDTITKEKIITADKKTLDELWEVLGFGSKSLWKI
ncbi:MAG: zf-HC2 domain-containing protein [Ignavibacteriales bacterium]|nr:MAG: zf-HC2 domain-containing protein [Ignavibacteriales bacterium]